MENEEGVSLLHNTSTTSVNSHSPAPHRRSGSVSTPKRPHSNSHSHTSPRAVTPTSHSHHHHLYAPSSSAKKVRSVLFAPKRVLSLDVFRGLAVVCMSFVNAGRFKGSNWGWISHAPWDGLHFADAVWPMFLFAVGNAMVFSFTASLGSKPARSIVVKVLRRTLLLCLIGIFISNFDGLRKPIDLATLRIPSVLGRIGVSYAIVALLLVTFPPVDKLRSFLPEISECWGAWGGVALLQVVYLLLTFLLPVPHCPTGYLGPGGTSDGGAHFNCTGGAAGFMDRQVFSHNHIAAWPACKDTYDCHGQDPWGILGLFPSTLNIMMGYTIGRIIQRPLSHRAKILRVAQWSLFQGTVGLALHFSGALPMNKSLYSLSYVFVTCALSGMILLPFYALVDVYEKWGGGFLVWVGQNPLFLYILSELITPTLQSFYVKEPGHHLEYYLWKGIYSHLGSENSGYMFYSLTIVGVMILVAFILRKRGLFIKL